MSKIQQIQSGSLSCSKPTKTKNIKSKQNFEGSTEKELETAKKIVLDAVEEKLNKKTGLTGKLFGWLADTKGELQTQTINGIFTTTLAPLMIVCNPFAKNKSKEDKQYLALRQPVSAIIALSGGLGMTWCVNKFQEKIYNEGFVKSIDLRLVPSKEYLESSFKKSYKEAKEKNQLKEFLALYDKDVSSTIKAKGINSKEYRNACFKQGYVKKIQEQRAEFFTNIISADIIKEPDCIKVNGDVISINGKDLQIGHIIKVPNLNTQSDLDAYVQKNSLYNNTLGDFMKEKFKFEFFEDGETGDKYKLHINDKKLSETKAIDFLEEIGLIEKGSVSESELKEILQKHRQNKHSPEYAKAHGISLENAKNGLGIVGSDTSRNIQMTVGEEIGKAKSISLGHLFHQLGYKTSDGKLQKLMDMNMSDALIKFKEIFEGKLKGIDEKTELKDFAKNIIKKTAASAGENAKNHKFYVGIVINLFTTAVTCTALNWAYPRFVETFFPKLAKSDNKPKFTEHSKLTEPPKMPVKIEAQKGGNN